MQGTVTVIKLVAVFIAATMLGRWFQDEIKKIQAVRISPYPDPAINGVLCKDFK